MRFFTTGTVFTALAALQTVSAAHTIDNGTTCATPIATATRIGERINCRRIACIKPSRVCSAGEPTAPERRPPFVTATVTPAPGACTAVAEAIDNPGCNLCPTCLPAVATPAPTA